MNWTYWVSGAAALVIFFYLIVALFRPERFE
jgi:K+-transporting ATPase KdpF subunit